MMSVENKIWSQYEDNALRTLREERQIKKWTLIVKLLDSEYGIKGKSSKRCRQRYLNHVSSSLCKGQWTIQEWNTLLAGHNELGNKWVELSKILKRSESSIKNYFHSKMRLALRRINQHASRFMLKSSKAIKLNLVPKIIQTAEAYFLQADKDCPSTARTCFLLKNKILEYLPEKDKTPQYPNEDNIAELKTLIREMNHFNKILKKRKTSSMKKVVSLNREICQNHPSSEQNISSQDSCHSQEENDQSKSHLEANVKIQQPLQQVQEEEVEERYQKREMEHPRVILESIPQQKQQTCFSYAWPISPPAMFHPINESMMFATSGYTFPGWQMWPNNYPLYSSLMLNAGNSTREDE